MMDDETREAIENLRSEMMVRLSYLNTRVGELEAFVAGSESQANKKPVTESDET
jgi:hypothetical protein